MFGLELNWPISRFRSAIEQVATDLHTFKREGEKKSERERAREREGRDKREFELVKREVREQIEGDGERKKRSSYFISCSTIIIQVPLLYCGYSKETPKQFKFTPKSNVEMENITLKIQKIFSNFQREYK